MRPEEQINNNDPNQQTNKGQDLAKEVQEQAFQGGKNAVSTYESAIQAPETPKVELPKGGGALRSIGEKFEANPVTGTANISVPIAMSSGRNGFQPQISLSYNSGGGNGIFGMGWSMGLASISRKTQKGLPQYNDANESDVFLLAGVEDLVPVLESEDGKYENVAETHDIQRYRPRVEGSFMKIERWTDQNDGKIHWRVTDKNNVVSVFGESQAAQIYSPENANKVFEWKIERRYDALGNIIEFEYKRENSDNVEASSPAEYNRVNKVNAFNQLYPKKIKYGNSEMYGGANWANNEWYFELVFDYGEHDGSDPYDDEHSDWELRQDPFSSFRSGFDIRTYRLCRRILMFHHFSGLNSGDPLLVKSTELTYDENPIGTQLQSVLHRGYDESTSKSLPPVSFTYTQAQPNENIQDLDKEDTDNLPAGIDGQNYQWADPNGEGIQGILTESANAWYFKPNYGHDNYYQEHPADYVPEPLVSFGKLQTLKQKPNGAAAASLQDMDGDGLQEAVIRDSGMAGFYKQNTEGEWTHFQHFDTHPNINFQSEDVKMVDLNGDGRADILITEQDHIEWIPYEDADVFVAKEKRRVKPGYGYRRKLSKALEEDAGPRVVFSNGRQNIFLSDMTGDGFSDLLRIENGSIDYWPHLGFGRFGAKVSLANVSAFDHPDQFDARRIRLGDIDGSGTTDLIYLGRSHSKYFINQSGNALANGVSLHSLPSIDSMQNVQLVDILGNGTSCLVWSSPHEKDKPYHIKYIDLMGGQKPYLLEEMDNGMGALRKFSYSPSTKFYLKDKRAGKPWITKLPFPVQCLERVEVFEQITQSRYVSRYAYHHGYFDPTEREFRGFGMVEQWDTELYEDFAEAALYQVGSNALEEESHSTPVYTKSWFHNGYYSQKNKIEAHYATEYWQGDAAAFELNAHAFPPNLSVDEQRQAHRALKGSLLRQEVYGLDETGDSGLPYVVNQSRYAIKEVQAQSEQLFGVYRAEQLESFSYQYEQDADDPRISQQLLLESDDYGNPLKTATIAYPRRGTGHETEQLQAHILYQENSFIHLDPAPTAGVMSDSNYHIGAAESEEVWEYRPDSFSAPILAADLLNELGTADIVNVENDFSGSQNEMRLLTKAKVLYYSQDLSTALSLGSIAKHGLPHHSEQLAFTNGLIDALYNDGSTTRIDPTITAGEDLLEAAGYMKSGSEWWLPSGRLVHDANAFYLPQSSLDAFGNQTDITYDSFNLLPEEITDPLGNVVAAANNYVHLQPTLQTDPNGNRQEVVMDALGMPLKKLVMGKASSHPDYTADEGDTLAASSETYAYDLEQFSNHQLPNYSTINQRERHVSDAEDTGASRKDIVFYDGLGNPIQQRIQFGALSGTNDADTPVAVSGRQIKNNKDLVVEQYEPYFETGFDYAAAADDSSLARIRLHYDALGRNTQANYDDGTFEKVEFTAWQQKNYDRNDTVVDSQWYVDRNSPDPGSAAPTNKDERSAWLAAQHYDTPQVLEMDTLGRMFLRQDDLGTTTLDSRFAYDLFGRRIKTTDPRGLTTDYNYNLISPPKEAEESPAPLFNDSPDAGKRFLLNDVAQKPHRRWNSRGFAYRHEYDDLQRPTELWVTPNGGAEYLAEKNTYGEGAGAAANKRGRLVQSFDQAGRKAIIAYDFKGNLTAQARKFATVFDTALDHNGSVSFESDTFFESFIFDALNRPTKETTPDDSVKTYSYAPSGLLNKVEIEVRGDISEDAITDIKYNARGQRTDIYYANGSKSAYTYDAATFRLKRILSTRNTGSDILQDLNYTFDAAGNIVHLKDDAQQTIYFSNSVEVPENKYEYDALYRLKKAEGREQATLNQPSNADIAIITPVPDTNTTALRSYTQNFTYDELGNITELQHVAGAGSYTKDYFYPATDNRLIGHQSGVTDYTYDEHGNMTSMPHLSSMQWDYNDLLIEADLGGGGTAYYRYDAGGNRVRKVIENGSDKKERLYLNSFERWQESTGSTVETERETLLVSDDQKQFLQLETLTIDSGSTISTPTTNWRFQYDNYIGSACLETDASANVISYEEYHPFGTSSYRSGNSAAEVSLKRYRYVGKEKDDETGLFNYGARLYAPWLARFISSDLLRDSYPYLNSYNYAGNKPITYFDIDGMQSNSDVDDEIEMSHPDKPEENKNDDAKMKEVSKHLESLGISLEELQKGIESIKDFLETDIKEGKFKDLKSESGDIFSITIPINNSLNQKMFVSGNTEGKFYMQLAGTGKSFNYGVLKIAGFNAGAGISIDTEGNISLVDKETAYFFGWEASRVKEFGKDAKYDLDISISIGKNGASLKYTLDLSKFEAPRSTGAGGYGISNRYIQEQVLKNENAASPTKIIRQKNLNDNKQNKRIKPTGIYAPYSIMQIIP